jgi:hypothetical protein
MELTAQTTIPVGGVQTLEFVWKNDDLPTGVTISSATKSVTPAAGLTVGNPVVNAASDGVTFSAQAVTAGSYSILILATRSDLMVNVGLYHVTVTAASDLTSAASNALVTVEQLSAVMGEQVSKNLADMVINSVSKEFDRFCGRALKATAYSNLYLDGNGEEILNLPSWPAASVTGVYEDDTLLVEGLDYDYVIYTSDDDAYLRKVNATWPEWDHATAVWLEGPKTIKITSVTLGYSTIPSDLQLAALKQCAYEYQRAKQKTWGETSRSKEGDSVSVLDPGLMPDVVAVLKRYRRQGL